MIYHNACRAHAFSTRHCNCCSVRTRRWFMHSTSGLQRLGCTESLLRLEFMPTGMLQPTWQSDDHCSQDDLRGIHRTHSLISMPDLQQTAACMTQSMLSWLCTFVSRASENPKCCSRRAELSEDACGGWLSRPLPLDPTSSCIAII